MMIVILSVVGIVLEEIKSGFIPINPTIIRVMRVMRIARGENAACCLIVSGVLDLSCILLLKKNPKMTFRFIVHH